MVQSNAMQQPTTLDVGRASVQIVGFLRLLMNKKTDKQMTLGCSKNLSRLHGAPNEISPKVEVVDGEHRLAGAFVAVADRGCRPVMAVDDVRPAHNSPCLTTSAALLNVRQRIPEFGMTSSGVPALLVEVVMLGEHACP